MRPPSTRTVLAVASEVFTPTRPRRWIAVLWSFIGLTALGLLFVFDPSQSRLFPNCLFRDLTGLQCPGCGSTRAIHHALHGEIMTAVQLNPLLVVFSPILGYTVVFIGALAVTGKELPQPRLPASWIWALLVVTIGFGVARNTPWWP